MVVREQLIGRNFLDICHYCDFSVLIYFGSSLGHDMVSAFPRMLGLPRANSRLRPYKRHESNLEHIVT